MRISKFSYSEHTGKPEEWNLLALDLQEINLIVGVNSSGKTRTLNVIAGLSKVLSGKMPSPYISGDYKVVFTDDKEKNLKTTYSIKFEQRAIASESLKIGNEQKLHRTQTGKGWLYAEAEQRRIDFKVPQDQVVVVARRDELQHPYLEQVVRWGRSLKHVQFGTELGKRTLSVITSTSELNRTPWADMDNSAAIIRRSLEEFGDAYKTKLLEDFAFVGYDCSDVGLKALPGLEHVASPPPIGLYVQERDLPGETTQISMSTGMYRALVILATVNAAVLSHQVESILIDDIGEGLDYERSRRLIQLLVERAQSHSFQLVMTTNDRFVMNAVPLKHWTVLHRTSNTVQSFNWRNSKKKFQEFEYLGLNNFDFFSGRYFLSQGE